MTGYSLGFQSNGHIVEFSGRSIPPLRTRTSKPAKHTVLGMGSNNSAEEILGILVRKNISNYASLISRLMYSDDCLLVQSIYHI